MPVLVVIVALLVAACGRADPDRGPDPAASVAQVLGDACGTDVVGSGVVVGDGLVLTSAHTVAGIEDGLQARRPGQAAVEAKLVGFDPNRDLALVTAVGLDGEAAVLGKADIDTAGMIGTMNPDGELELLGYEVDRLVTANSSDIYDEGEVSRSALQLSARTLPGDSGGALFDSKNQVVGLVFAQSRFGDDVAYALAISEIEQFLAEVDRATEVPAGRCA